MIRRTVRAFRRHLPYRFRRPTRPPLPADLSSNDRTIMERIAPYTMTSVERQRALIDAIRYLVKYRIAGCVVECGVWRGGSSMAAALTLLQEGDATRQFFLFDTFEGMTPPTDVDRSMEGVLAQVHLDSDVTRRGIMWAVAGIDDVTRNMNSTGYPSHLIQYVKGSVETTLPGCAPSEPIAFLRLDTDWYESTKHELTHLFPRLQSGGVLLIDDYGHWAGARLAVDEYFAGYDRPVYLHRVDYTGRLMVR